ncbi:hypothetical protein CATYP_00745 [Corynebacterium atypicum]|uniref:DUF559 domain-containing protein n=2 Tax=Corynebacterium atypicum TaxID=191610 RepID=A0ABN4DAW6_9CORY|nr:hypothetical protein CATYP_00745 [Corynebacterium atypicum]
MENRGIIVGNQLPNARRRALYRSVEKGHAFRLATGIFITMEDWQAATKKQRWLMRIAAHQMSLPDSVVLGAAAAASSGIAVHRAAFDSVIHLGFRARSRPRPRPGVKFHRVPSAVLAQAVTVNQDGVEVSTCNPADAVMSVACFQDLTSGLISAESASNQRIVGYSDLLAAATRFRGRPGARSLGKLVQLAGPWSESPRETELKLMFRHYGFPEPLQQVEIFDAADGFVARVDFFFREAGLIVEYEGAAKTAGPGGQRTAVHELERARNLHNLGFVIRHVRAEEFRQPSTFTELKELYFKLCARGAAPDPRLWRLPLTPQQWDHVY